jgi:hypothetical protein
MKDQAKHYHTLINRNLSKLEQTIFIMMKWLVKINIEERLMVIDHIHLLIIWDLMQQVKKEQMIHIKLGKQIPNRYKSKNLGVTMKTI